MNSPTPRQREAVRCRPEGERPVMYQTWSDLLFLHWQVEAAELQKTLPDGLFIDTFDNSAWLGVVPFKMRHIRPVGLFPLPWISYFLELNVRTYVHDEHGNPGVWFYSLDTDRWIAYKIARTAFKLPYFPGKMSATRRDDGMLDYRCQRNGTGLGESHFLYRAADETPKESATGTLEFFLLERYLLFSHDPAKRQLFTGQVNHLPYRFRAAEVAQWDTLPVKWDGLPEVAGPPAHAGIAEAVDVAVYPLKKVVSPSTTSLHSV